MWMRLVLALSLLCFSFVYEQGFDAKSTQYPDFKNNPFLSSKMRDEIKDYLIPVNHPAKPVLDALFLQSRVIESEETLLAAGFTILFSQESSFVKVVSHPLLPGYLLKLYLDNETRLKDGRPGWEWLKDRCKGAKKIRKFIKEKKLKHFVVPDKFIYILPSSIGTSGPIHQPFVIIVTDMQLVSHEENKWAWMNLATKEVLDELYKVLHKGYGSRFLTGNVPYTKRGKFAFIDTEYPKRHVSLEKAKPYLNPEMQRYWDSLIN